LDFPAYFSNFINEQSLQLGERLAEGQNPVVGELTGADYIMEGAVTEYQVDKKSGGLGIAIGGVGATDQYAVASTAIDLRLLNTTTGEVVWAKSLKREITGEKIGLQLFSFIGNNIVEIETGRGKQEVINLVIRTLLEEAVFKLATNNNF
jgi:curli biogenesis system outer membrane secretion channel CsgG